MADGLRQRRSDLRSSIETHEDHDKNKQDAGKKLINKMWLTFLLIAILVICLPVIVLLCLPSPIDAQPVERTTLPPLAGALAPNDILTQSRRLYVNQLNGPESIEFHNGYLFTGTSDGKLLRLKDGMVEQFVMRGNEPCGPYDNEERCGRPLGMRIHKPDGYLYFLDAYYGLSRVNLDTSKLEVIWPSSAHIGGYKAKFLNDLDISNSGLIYISDSSMKWQRKDFPMLFLEAESSGRLIEYDMNTNTTRELMSGLSFSNGVQLSPDEDFVLVIESLRKRIWKYHLKGHLKGSYEIFIDNLPGIPDNIRASSGGGYWVGMAAVMHSGKFSFLDYTSDKTWLRNLLSKLGNQFILMFATRYGLVIELDQKGQIVRSLHDPTGQVIPSVSEVHDTGSSLFLGSYGLPFLSELDFVAKND